MITQIENLSNEIFYEIFDYLDGCQLCDAFSGLNTRFQNLLNGSFLQLKVQLSLSRDTNSKDHYMTIISERRQNIISFHLLDWSTINIYFTLMTFDSSFYRLESFGLIGIQSNGLVQRLTVLTSLPRLFSFTLLIRGYIQNLSDVYQLIFRLPVLKYIKVSCNEYDPDILLPIANNNHFSPITHLHVNHSCRLNDLIVMLSYTPDLHYLSCKSLIDSNKNIQEMRVSLPNLTHVFIRSYRLQFNEFVMFIKKISCQLQVLRTGFYFLNDYVNADRWERLILQDMPYLRRFHFWHQEMISRELNVTEFYTLINRFPSLFWIERQWMPNLSIYIRGLICNEFIFSVHPYKKRCEELSEYGENNIDYNRDIATNQIQHAITSRELQTDKFVSQSFLSTEIVVDYISDRCNIAFLQIIDPIVKVIKITHLNIRNHGFPIDTFLKFLCLLPDLDSLKVSSLSSTELDYLSDEDLNTFYSLNNNKITMVIIEKMIDLAQIQFLIHLCPHMKYFEIHSSSDIDCKSLIRFILVENHEYISYLRVICVDIQTENDELVEELQQMINVQKLHYNCRIKRLCNQIYMEWI